MTVSVQHLIDAADREVLDSTDPSVADHVRRYLATDGADGYLEGGMTNLVLTTIGRRSGKLRRTGLFFGVDGDRYVLVASGTEVSNSHPDWYHNVLAHPEVHVQVRGDRFLARARDTEGEERERLWRMMTELAPIYHSYRRPGIHRTIPVVVLEPAGG